MSKEQIPGCIIMKYSISLWQVAGFIFTSVLGTFLHFLFDLTGGAIAAALFSAVNESIWEHMKLLYYPMVLFAVIEYRVWGREEPRFWCIKLAGTAFGLLLIPTIYYLYTGILGVNADWFNVTIFFIAAAAAFWLETKLFERQGVCMLRSGGARVILLGIVAVFIFLTFYPPRIPFFQDPVTGTYGFQMK